MNRQFTRRYLSLFIAILGLPVLSGCIGGPAGNQTSPSCGNKVLEGGEQCEAGIPCQNSSLVCNSDCRCVPPAPGTKENVSCAINAGRVNNSLAWDLPSWFLSCHSSKRE